MLSVQSLPALGKICVELYYLEKTKFFKSIFMIIIYCSIPIKLKSELAIINYFSNIIDYYINSKCDVLLFCLIYCVIISLNC